MSEKKAAEQAFTLPRHGSIGWTEIATDKLEECRKFYAEVFGWQFKKSGATGDEMEYLEFSADGKNFMGGLFEMKPEWYGGEMPAPHSNMYVAVDDVDQSADKALDLGGVIVGEPCDVPNVGRMCQIEDPTGAKFFIIRLKT